MRLFTVLSVPEITSVSILTTYTETSLMFRLEICNKMGSSQRAIFASTQSIKKICIYSVVASVFVTALWLWYNKEEVDFFRVGRS